MAAWTRKQEAEVARRVNLGQSVRLIAQEMGKTRGSVAHIARKLKKGGSLVRAEDTGDAGCSISAGDDGMVVTLRSKTTRTLKGLLKTAEVDQDVWEIDRWVANKWDIVSRCNLEPKPGQKFPAHKLKAAELWQVKAWFRRKAPKQTSLEALTRELSRRSPRVPRLSRRVPYKHPKRALEVSVLDPHIGMAVAAQDAGLDVTIEDCEQAVLGSVERILKLAEPFGPFEEIVMPLGSDWLHSDTIWGATAGQTPQPESAEWHSIFLRGELLGTAVIEAAKEFAPVKVVMVPGNHDRQSSFALGRIWNAHYRRDRNVSVDCHQSPYKFWKYGVNLVGFDHGHNINQIRLAALMANETRDSGWADARFCEWHLGDQHRKGSSKTSTMEEQGVSVEYLPGLTAPNTWHRLKSFNWQKRAGMGFVWDKSYGPLARLQVNIDNYTGYFMGEEKPK